MKTLTLICAILLSAACAASTLVPEISNSGFEEGANGWGWQTYNGCNVRYRSESRDPHSGKACLAFVDESPAAPNVYGRLTTGVGVLPDTQYELSVWVRGTEVSDTGGAVPHFTDWGCYTLNLPTGTFGWKRAAVTFKTKPGQFVLTLGLNITNTCKELAIDDVSLRPVGQPLTGDGVTGSFLAPTRVIGDHAPGYVGVFIDSAPDSATAEAVITAPGGEKLFSKRQKLGPERMVEWAWDSGTSPAGDMVCTVRVLGAKGQVLATASQKVAKVQSPISAEIDRADVRFRGEFTSLYKQCQAKGIRLDYPTATKTMLEQFIPLAREDVQKGHDWRAQFGAKDFHRALDESIADMKAYLKDPKLAPVVRRYKTGKLDIEGLSVIGDRIDSTGKTDRGPLFFCGYGHFSQVRRDMPRWPGYGVNIIQIEVGPSVTLTSETQVSLTAVRDIAKVLDDAAKHNVKVDVLLSPHYFPQWAIDKWPHLAKGGGHFLGYEVDAPEAKQVIEKFLRTVVPILKDKPALHSFCLSNEPVFSNTANADGTKPKWAAYLAKVHGDVAAMNSHYGTSYKSFDDVPIPGNEAYDAPQFYDYVCFNNQRFADWHAWMAGVIRSMAPKVPLHAKMMSMALPHRFTVAWGCDPELFGEFSDMNGNDCLIRGPIGNGWFLPFHLQNMSYDLQRSLNRKPIFNSENHPTDDRSTYYVNPEHFRTALWQGAIHGQSSTTIWCWERCYEQNNDLYGNVMDRPGCALATGTTVLDLNRFAEEVTALQNVKSPVAIIFSIASITRQPKYQEVLYHAYCALNFSGVKIDFISEKQLQEGKGRDYRMLILPQATHVQPATFDAVRALPASTRVVIIGDSLTKDPYGKDYPEDEIKTLRDSSMCIADGDAERALRPALTRELERLRALPEVRVVDPATGEPLWGVEWLPVKLEGRTLVNVVNLTDKPKQVSLVRGPDMLPARDLLSLGGRESVGLLKPGTPVLAEVSLTPASTGNGPSAGELRIIFNGPDGKPVPKAQIKELICRDLTDEPVISEIHIADGRATVSLPADHKPVQVSALFKVPDFGEVAVYADHGGKGYGNSATIDFVKEAAITRRLRVKAAIEQAKKEGLVGLDALSARVTDSVKLPPYQSLAVTLAVGEEVTLKRAQHRIARMSLPRTGFLFGCNAFGHPQRGPLFQPRFQGVFNYGTTNLYLSRYAPTIDQRDYSRCDAETEWLLSMGMTTKPCPPFYLAGGVTPQWLRDLSWPEVKAACRELVKGVCAHYAGRTPFCEITNEATMSNSLGLTTEQIIEYTRIASEAAREGDPKVRRIINSAHLWGDYAAKPDKQGNPRLSPFAYLRACIKAGIQFEIVGLQMYYPEYDLLEIDRMLERYAALGKPIHITEMGCASADGIDPNAQRKKAAAGWHGPWTEQMQADWVEAVYTIFYSKPYIEAVSWWDLADAVSFWPYGGLCRGDLSPKPSYERLKALQQRWGVSLPAPNRKPGNE